jgi:DNA-directed RNA polymerase specialized sigma subunit
MTRPPTFRRQLGATKARLATINAVSERLRRDLGREPSDEEIAAFLATNVKFVTRARAGMLRS